MAETIVNLIGFENVTVRIKDVPEKVVKVKGFEEVVIVVPGSGGEDGFDYSLDFDL